MKYLTSPKVIIITILLLGLFFRTYKLETFYPWGHDQDLFAWIAKDIVIDHHIRLIGQQTTILGVFIGPIFFYLMALSFASFQMNPLSSAIPITVIALATIISFYFVFNKFFGSRVGLIGAFLYAASPGMIFFSRWAVPTQPTTLWCIWYLYVLLSIIKGRIPLIVLGILVGLIWHIHIALLPLLFLLPIAFFLAKKPWNKFGISKRGIFISFLVFITLMFPFFAFELRHNFLQTQSLIKASYEDKGEVKGYSRLIKTINLGGRSFAGAFLLSNATISLNNTLTTLLPFLFIWSILYLSKRGLTRNQALLLGSWTGVVFLGQLLSKTQISEHYFGSLTAVLFLVISLFLNKLKILIIFLIIYLGIVFVWFIQKPDDFSSFLYKKQTIEYIKKNSLENGYPCIGINFIENNISKGDGFRYFYWLFNLNVISGGTYVPTYNIVTPWTISAGEIDSRFGLFGVINPEKKELDPKVCSDPNKQLLHLWGFTN